MSQSIYKPIGVRLRLLAREKLATLDPRGAPFCATMREVTFEVRSPANFHDRSTESPVISRARVGGGRHKAPGAIAQITDAFCTIFGTVGEEQAQKAHASARPGCRKCGKAAAILTDSDAEA